MKAVWFSNEESFSFIMGHYAKTTKNGSKGLEMALLLSIIIGSSYKVMELVKYADLGYNYGLDTTALFAAADLGRLDISNILIEAGAPDNLDQIKESAMTFGHFDIVEFIDKKLALKELADRFVSTEEPGEGSRSDVVGDEDVGDDESELGTP
ncbi:hypothetical protein AA313_de0208870 [Arthrobotrys entomopaga]|nr:hypothetical protein AA313_de0208870 [Arthrobotrys entomopaga]